MEAPSTKIDCDENVDQFGTAAGDIRFLLRQLDAARSAQLPSKVS
jgi:hypothetical protein